MVRISIRASVKATFVQNQSNVSDRPLQITEYLILIGDFGLIFEVYKSQVMAIIHKIW